MSPSSSLPRGDFSSGGEMVARLLGFLRLPTSWQEMLNVCVSYCSATLTLSDYLVANVTPEVKDGCKAVKLADNFSLDKIPVDFKSRKIVNIQAIYMQQNKMELSHYKDSEEAFKVSFIIYFKSIEPIFNFNILVFYYLRIFENNEFLKSRSR